MKKHLLKLFNEAGFHQPEMERLSVEHKFEKFAELIVRECIKQNRSHMINLTHRDFYLGWNDAITHCNESAKEHFGIFGIEE
jgi:hypothetical protein